MNVLFSWSRKPFCSSCLDNCDSFAPSPRAAAAGEAGGRRCRRRPAGPEGVKRKGRAGPSHSLAGRFVSSRRRPPPPPRRSAACPGSAATGRAAQAPGSEGRHRTSSSSSSRSAGGQQQQQRRHARRTTHNMSPRRKMAAPAPVAAAGTGLLLRLPPPPGSELPCGRREGRRSGSVVAVVPVPAGLGSQRSPVLVSGCCWLAAFRAWEGSVRVPRRT